MILCLRQNGFKKLFPKRPKPKQLQYFINGAARHEILQKIYGKGVSEKKGRFLAVDYSIDIFDNGEPIEIKTTFASHDKPQHYQDQIAYYMLATKAAIGHLLIIRENPRIESPFEPYRMEWESEEESESYRKRLIEKRDLLMVALQNKDVSSLPIWRGEKDWLCRNCLWREECDKIEGIIR